MNTQTAVREFCLLGLLMLNVYIAYTFTMNEHNYFSLLEGDVLQTFVVFLGGSTVITSVLAVFIFRRFRNNFALASSRLLNFKQVKGEQRRARNTVFHTKRQRKYKTDTSAMPVSKNLKLATKKSFEHVLLVGPTGSGKSSSVFIPILNEIDDISLVVTDPKSELHNKTKTLFAERGYKVYHLNLYNASVSVAYNLLGNCRTLDDIRKLSETILGNDEWGRLSKTLLEAFLFKIWEEEGTLTDVVDALANAPTDMEELELEYFTNVSTEALRAFKQFAKTAQGDGFVSSVFATIQSKMKVFEFDNVQAISQGDSLDVSLLRKEKSVLFVSYPEDESEVYSSFLSSFYYQLFNYIKNDSSVSEETGDGQGLGVLFLLDEFANLGYVPAIDTLLSTIRSKKMGMMLGVQSVAQLRKVYGDSYDTIVENCKTKIALGGITGATAEFFVKLAGKEQYTNLSHSYGDSNSSMSMSEQTKNVLNEDDIRRLKTYELIVIADNLRPIKDYRNFYYLNNLQYFIWRNSPFSNDFTDKLMYLARSRKKR
ncbi:TPA: type IV secretory system conjugative DNA transfer family protein [Bacillus cereus]